jgi:hypothetical protein
VGWFLATGLAIAVMGTAAVGWLAQRPAGQPLSPAAASFPDPGPVHVHELGVDPADGALYAATHMGLFRLPDTQAGEAVRIADRWQDTMAFTVVGPNRFLASGHPDLRENKPVLLGLIESRDAGQTWQPLSLEGSSDFHALQPAGPVLYGYDSTAEQLLITQDRRRWEHRAALALIALAVDPAHPQTLLAATPMEQLRRSVDGGRSFSPVPGAPRLTALVWPPSGPVYGTSRNGTLLSSGNGGRTWQTIGKLDGPVEALTATDARTLHAATATGIYSSTDGGATFTLRYRIH